MMSLTIDKNSVSYLLYMSLLRISQTDVVVGREKLDVSIRSVAKVKLSAQFPCLCSPYTVDGSGTEDEGEGVV